jgi:nitrilase
MSDVYPTIKVAAVQAVTPFLDREAATEKACALILEAGRMGAQLIVFPEGFIPSHPNWYHHHVATGPIAMDLALRLFKNSVAIPGPEITALCNAAKEAKAYVVMGVCEKADGALGTMFNSQVHIGPDGALIGKHQKTMPTVGERIVHAGGYGDTFGAFATEHGPMSSLICGENGNPLAVFALAAEQTRIHAMSWPPYVGSAARPLRQVVELHSRAFAVMAGCYVVSSCGALDEATIAAMQLSDDQATRVRDPAFTGGSIIVSPGGDIIAGPLGDEEGIIYADCDIEKSVKQKLVTDYTGHYNRADIFQLKVNKAPGQLLRNWQPGDAD